jgi:hypothetical protein
MSLQANSNTAEEIDDCGISFLTDGRIITSHSFDTATLTAPANWYSPTTTGIGSSYGIRFTLQSGTPWNMGALTSGVTYALSTLRTVGWEFEFPGTAVATVLVEIITTATGAVYKSGTLTVNLTKTD